MELTAGQTLQSCERKQTAAWKPRSVGPLHWSPQQKQTMAWEAWSAGAAPTQVAEQITEQMIELVTELMTQLVTEVGVEVVVELILQNLQNRRQEQVLLPDTSCSHTKSRYGCRGRLCPGWPHPGNPQWFWGQTGHQSFPPDE